jgi:transposase-like protein
MLGDPERPLCPLCQRFTMILIATMTGERALDIYLCPQCRTQFSYEHPKAKDQTPDLKPVSDVPPVIRARGVS